MSNVPCRTAARCFPCSLIEAIRPSMRGDSRHSTIHCQDVLWSTSDCELTVRFLTFGVVTPVALGAMPAPLQQRQRSAISCAPRVTRKPSLPESVCLFLRDSSTSVFLLEGGAVTFRVIWRSLSELFVVVSMHAGAERSVRGVSGSCAGALSPDSTVSRTTALPAVGRVRCPPLLSYRLGMRTIRRDTGSRRWKA